METEKTVSGDIREQEIENREIDRIYRYNKELLYRMERIEKEMQKRYAEMEERERIKRLPLLDRINAYLMWKVKQDMKKQFRGRILSTVPTTMDYKETIKRVFKDKREELLQKVFKREPYRDAAGEILKDPQLRDTAYRAGVLHELVETNKRLDQYLRVVQDRSQFKKLLDRVDELSLNRPKRVVARRLEKTLDKGRCRER